jgi:anthranilate phosphoribosyltransferase
VIINTMDQLIAKIGKGVKGAKDLTWDEAKSALNTIIEGQATDIQVGAFLMAMRIKTESIGELAAFTATVRNCAPPIPLPHPEKIVDVPLSGEKHHTIHVMIAASLVAASAGAGMFLHGVENPKIPYDLPQVLRHLKLPISQTAAEAVEHASQRPWVYMDLAGYHAPLTKLLDLRRELGLQNLSHQLARLLNPARVASQIIGISHPPYLDKMVEALDMLGATRALIIQGVEGFPELSISAPSLARELRRGHISSLIFRPNDAGFRFGPFQTMSSAMNGPGSGNPAHEAHVITQLLSGRQRGDQRAWVIVNAALLLYAAGLAPSLAQATPLAQDTLDSGKAGTFLTTLSQGNSPQTQSVSSWTPAGIPV